MRLVYEINIWRIEDNIIAGTRAGGLRASLTNKQKYGEDFYANIGKLGGENGHTGGFANDTIIGKDGLTGRQRAIIAGSIGGKKSRRTKKETV